MASELSNIVTLILSFGVISFFVKVYVDIKRDKEELEALKNEAIKKGLEDEKAKIHKEYDDKSLDSLIDSSGDVYSKLGSKKDN